MADAQPQPRRFARTRTLCGYLSIAAASFAIAVHWFQFDSLAAVTLVPPWLWFVPAAAATALSAKVASKKTTAASIMLWLAFGTLFVEEAGSLLRYCVVGQSRQATESAVRVVTLNCCIGSVDAAQEALQQRPDILLLQESPGAPALKALSEQLHGGEPSWISSGDASIIASGSVEAIVADPESHFAHGVVTLPDGQKVDVVSLRLSPPVFRMDFWSIGFWNDHRETRIRHRKQLAQIKQHLENHARTDRLILGGDFNLVGNDGALRPFTDDSKSSFRDTFYSAGIGWCNSGTSDYPLFRVDQIWTDGPLKALSNRTIRTLNSDHRMVVVDLHLQ